MHMYLQTAILLDPTIYGRHTELVHKYDTSVSHMLNGFFTNCDILLVSSYLV